MTNHQQKFVLILFEKYNGIKIEIDPTTFTYYGMVRESRDMEQHSCISFVPVEEGIEPEQIMHDLRNILSYDRENKEKYVGIRYKAESYDKDQRQRIWVRLPSGMQGFTNPAYFRIELRK